MTFHIALQLPYGDGSGCCKILGLYDNPVKAQARCFRVGTGDFYPTEVIEVTLNEDIIDE